MRNLDSQTDELTTNNQVAYSFLPRRKNMLEDNESATQAIDTSTPLASDQNSPDALNLLVRSEQQALFDQIRLQLGSTLQTSLSPATILDNFFSQLAILADISGLQFTGNHLSFTHQCGNKSIHSLSYQLDTGKQDVGEVVYYSRSRMSGLKLELLELATSSLVFPILNAQLHQLALTQAETDPLTKLANRRSLENHLPSQTASAHRYQRPLSALMIDIDHFKKLNDSCGHQFGDKVLQNVASALENTARTSDRVFRYGGEEFVCILDSTDAKDAQIMAERLRKAVASIELYEPHNDKKRELSVSIGYAELAENEKPELLLHRADKALYQAKNQGRNCAVRG